MKKKTAAEKAVGRQRAMELAAGLMARLPKSFTLPGSIVDGKVIAPDLVFEAHESIPGLFTAKADKRFISGDFTSNGKEKNNGSANGKVNGKPASNDTDLEK